MKRILMIILIISTLLSCKQSGDITSKNDLIARYDTKTRVMTLDDRVLDFKNTDITEIIKNMGEYEKKLYKTPDTDIYLSKLYPFDTSYNQYRIDLGLAFLKKGEKYSKYKCNYEKTILHFDDIIISNKTNINYLKHELDKRKIPYKISQGDLLKIDYNPVRYEFVFSNFGIRIKEFYCVFAFKPYEEDGFEMGLKKSK